MQSGLPSNLEVNLVVFYMLILAFHVLGTTLLVVLLKIFRIAQLFLRYFLNFFQFFYCFLLVLVFYNFVLFHYI